jgi:uncharacterized protein (DUF983 family)
MITCPYCGTHYQTFQLNCQNCGAPLPAAATETVPVEINTELPIPPSPPRPVSKSYVWRLLSTDGGWIAALVFILLGIIFSGVGLGLGLAINPDFIGWIFLIIGFPFLLAGVIVFNWRYQKAQKVVGVLRDGIAVRGQITELNQDYSVSINGRNPWNISYEYRVNGITYTGKVSTLNQPGAQMVVGKAVSILYLEADPKSSSLYPHP